MDFNFIISHIRLIRLYLWNIKLEIRINDRLILNHLVYHKFNHCCQYIMKIFLTHHHKYKIKVKYIWLIQIRLIFKLNIFIVREILEVCEMARSMFERYGGFAKINRIVVSFYEKMTTSPITKKYFEKTNMRRLMDHQTKFIASMMGGPASYSNEHLERVHARLGITETAFVETVDILTETLEDFDLDDSDVRQVRDEVMSRKNHVVKKG